jgi:RNA polymerase sigma factor (sigma-70 family)
VSRPQEPTPLSNTPNPAERGRFSAPRKAASVLRLLRGESLELLARELGVTAATLAGWRDDFLAGGQAALMSRPADDRDEEIARLRAKVGELPVYLWLRLVVGERMQRIHRRHLGAAMRDAGREVSLHRGALPQASTASLAAQLLGRFTTASEALIRAEVRLQVQEALDQMEPIDREVIALRHFEELSNGEAAEVLGITPQAASNRHLRALARLQAILKDVPGLLGQEGHRPK